MTGPGFHVMTAPDITAPDADARATCLRLVGALDLDGVPQLRTALADCFALRPDRVVLDLWDLRFCDCAGLNVMVEAKATADRSAAELRVEGALAQVARLFALTGVDEVFADTLPRLPPRTVL
ncbi:STAS domain-containing protein [Streptomyces sp. NPDC059982]|uniref:STAS domain-containing protein n=1 Tax=unclassified Streptomyces TaxID=2593676 RepID=UPI0036C10107